VRQPSTDDLPVSHCLAEIVAAVRESAPVVLKAPPGAGKTTGVPPALLAAGIAEEGQILLVQPRRLAARSAASRLAHLTGTRLGGEVGYHVRFDRRASAGTKLLVMTTGVLLRRLQSDPLLENVSGVLLDEFHERSLEVDLALGMLHRIRSTLRPELKLIVMSATLDPQPIKQFLGGGAVAIVSEGRSFPVQVEYAQQTRHERIEDRISDVLPEMMRQTSGHILVFLPGVGEIRRTHQAIARGGASDARIVHLYGDLSPNDQDAVLQESGGRKVILSTNVAETSVTIPGVTGVIDSGLVRMMRYDSAVGLPKLQLEPISQASAEQRAGRAGRTQPGVCLRLWPAVAHRSRPERDMPEIERGDFSGAALRLAAWGERDPLQFPWLTPPPTHAVDAATQLLGKLDAIEQDFSLTDIGRQMVNLPIHPRLARFMLAGAEFAMVPDAAIAAALLTERDPLSPESDSGAAAHGCDVSDKVERLKAFFGGKPNRSIEPAAAKQIRTVADHLQRCMERDSSQNDSQSHPSGENRMARVLLAAYPDRVARRREPSSDRGLMVGGRGVRLDRRSRVRSGELFLCVDVDARASEAIVRSACVIEPQWLDERLIRVVDEYSLNHENGAVIARRRRYFDDLLLSEQPIPCQPGEHVAKLLADAARADLAREFPSDMQEVSSFIGRARFVAQVMPKLNLPSLDDACLDRVLVTLCQSRTTLNQIRQAPWLDHLRGLFDYDQLRMIDRHAPARIKVPSGNLIRVEYAEDQPPTMEVRIQELYGLPETPRVAGGKVPIRLHLLGPNYRAQQITEDLGNFWSTTYQQVRKELRRRYPKHHWPEEPNSAVATPNGLKPRTKS
jgi:ATP-dependent helicase HrpB